MSKELPGKLTILLYYRFATSVLEYEKNWGMNLNYIPSLTHELTKCLELIESLGIKEAIKIVL